MRMFKPWTACALTCLFVSAIFFGLYGLKTSAQSSPLTLPLLTEGSISYVGGFRLPSASMTGTSFEYGGSPIAFNPANNSLFVGSVNNNVAEIGIPTPVNSADAKAMPEATYLQQAFVDPTEGHMGDVYGGSNGIYHYGLLVYGNRLHGATSIYYDAANNQRVSHFSRSLSLTQSSFSGWSQVWQADRQGFVAGMMALVPSEWQALLGGPAIAGQCCIPIISRTSYGPSAFAFNPALVGQPTVAAQPLLYYDINHRTLGPWEEQNPTYGMTTRVGGVAIIAGTRTALYVGSNGLGQPCYGTGTADRALADASLTDNICYDPTDPHQGNHAYPYRYQIWAYDLSDFAAVKSGAKQPWEVVPYGVWPLEFPTQALHLQIGGVAYDAQRQLLYVSQRDANQGTYSTSPVIHAFRLDATGAAPAPSASRVSNVTLATDKAAPQTVGTPITFTAQATGGVAPYQYKWVISNGTTSTVAADWTTSNRYVWTPSSPNVNYNVTVWVRGAGNTADAAEVSTSMPFAINGTGATSSVGLTANRVAPQPPFTAITWTAVPVGGAAPHQYKWLVSDGTTSTVLANWSTTSSFIWTPSTSNANYRVTVWARSAGNTSDAQEAAASAAFPIQESGSSGGGIAAVSAVSLSADKSQPQAAGSSITWTARGTGGVAPLAYKWFVFDGSTWTLGADWSTNTIFAWTPAAANPNYRVLVWAKSYGNPNDKADVTADQGFAITAPTGGTTPTGTPVSHVTLTSNKPSPQNVGSTVVFTAQAFNGSAPYQYQWWIFDGQRWTAATSWLTSATFSWTPSKGDPKYQVAVRARSAGSTSDAGEATLAMPFVINSGKGGK